MINHEKTNLSSFTKLNSCTKSGRPESIQGKFGTLTISGDYKAVGGDHCPIGCTMSYKFKGDGVRAALKDKVVKVEVLKNFKLRQHADTTIMDRYLPSGFTTTQIDSGAVCTDVKGNIGTITNGGVAGTEVGDVDPTIPIIPPDPITPTNPTTPTDPEPTNPTPGGEVETPSNPTPGGEVAPPVLTKQCSAVKGTPVNYTYMNVPVGFIEDLYVLDDIVYFDAGSVTFETETPDPRYIYNFPTLSVDDSEYMGYSNGNNVSKAKASMSNNILTNSGVTGKIGSFGAINEATWGSSILNGKYAFTQGAVLQFRPTVGAEPASFEVIVEGKQFCFSLSPDKHPHYKYFQDNRGHIYNYRRYNIVGADQLKTFRGLMLSKLNSTISVGFAINK